MNELRNGALYIRVSTDKQEELSPDAQRRLLLDYAAKNNIIISNEYIFEEDGISGRKADKRPAFQQMIGLAKSREHPFDVILVWKFSRFARNQEESIVYKSLLRKNHVEVISVSEPLVDGPFGSLIERIIEWMDEYYSIRLSDEVMRGMTENALRGNNQASPALGYEVKSYKATPTIVESEAALVRMIFDMYVNQNIPIVAIVRNLNAMGYRTRRGNTFETKGIHYILSNPVYTGQIAWNRRNSSSKAKDKSEWIVVEGSHEPIIDSETFQKAQAKLNSASRKFFNKPSTVCKHWLSGIVKCSSCGKTLCFSLAAPNRYGVRYAHFQCNGYTKGKCVESHCVSEKKLVPMVLKAFETAINSDNLKFRVISAESSENNTAIDALRKKLESIEKKEGRIKSAYIDGVDTIDEYKKNKKLLQEERLSIEKKLSEFEKPAVRNHSDNSAALRCKLKTVYDSLQNESLSMQARNELIKSVVEKIVFDKKNERIDVYFYTTEAL